MVIDNGPLGQKAVLNDRFGHDIMKLWIHTQPAKSNYSSVSHTAHFPRQIDVDLTRSMDFLVERVVRIVRNRGVRIEYPGN